MNYLSIALALASVVSTAPVTPNTSHKLASGSVFGEPLLLANKSYPFAHEAVAYLPGLSALYFASNRLSTSSKGDLQAATPDDGTNQDIYSYLYAFQNKTALSTNSGRLERLVIDIPMPNGAIAISPTRLLVCGQGNITAPAGIYELDFETMKSKPLVTYFELPMSSDGLSRVLEEPLANVSMNSNGRVRLPFNSPNDLVLSHRKTELWFTDPIYGYLQDFRPRPKLYNGVYVALYNASSEQISPVTAVFPDLVRPNGIALSLNDSVLFVSESGYYPGDGRIKASVPHAVYAYDIIRTGTSISLTNKRLFAVTPAPVPDGIKMDSMNRLFVGDGSGLLVYSDNGSLLDAISPQQYGSHGSTTETGVTNFDFDPESKVIFATAETSLYAIPLLN